VGLFTAIVTFIKKNSQATTKCDAGRNWSTYFSSIARSKRKLDNKPLLKRWVTWVHANFKVHITNKLMTELWGSCKFQFAHTLNWCVKIRKIRHSRTMDLIHQSILIVLHNYCVLSVVQPYSNTTTNSTAKPLSDCISSTVTDLLR